jgi:hypothetical protein
MSTGVCVASGASMVPYPSSPGRFPDSPHQDGLRPASECESVDELGETGLWDEETTPCWRARSAKPLGRIRQRNVLVPNVNTIDRATICRPLPVPQVRGQRPLPIREHLDQVKCGVDGRLWGEVWPVMLSRSGVPVKDSRVLREGVLFVVLVLGLGSWGVAIWAAFA